LPGGSWEAEVIVDMSKYRDLFLSETREHLTRMSQLLVTLEREPGQRETIDELFREAHSVKGMAASMGYARMAELGHHLEDSLDRFRSGGAVPTTAIDHLLSGCDLLEGLLEDAAGEHPEREIAPFLAKAGALADTLEPEERLSPDANTTPDLQLEPVAEALAVLVSLASQTTAPAARALLVLSELEAVGQVSRLQPSREDLLSGQPVHELSLILRTALTPVEVEQRLLGMTDIARVQIECAAETEPLPRRRREDRERTVRVRTELLDRLISLAGELITNRYRLQEVNSAGQMDDLPEALDEHNRLIDNLHRDVLQVRLMPLESITGRIPRLVRDHCRTNDKQVTLDIEGAEVELDRAVLEELGDPLMHLVRNAIDHGIADKGRLSIRASRERDLVLLEVADDGRGVDPQRVRKRAVEIGLPVSSPSGPLSDRELLQLICQPGFSTATEVTELSGRGVGMDAVKAAVEKVGGQMEMSSQVGEGTRMLLRLPLSAAIMRVLLVSCRPHSLALPISRIVQVLEVERQDIQHSGRQRVIQYQEELVPLLSLRKLLHLEGHSLAGLAPVVVCDLRGRRIGLVVDQLIDQREVFVRSLEPPLVDLPGVSGATVLGNGELVFVLDPTALLDSHELAEKQLRVANA